MRLLSSQMTHIFSWWVQPTMVALLVPQFPTLIRTIGTLTSATEDPEETRLIDPVVIMSMCHCYIFSTYCSWCINILQALYFTTMDIHQLSPGLYPSLSFHLA